MSIRRAARSLPFLAVAALVLPATASIPIPRSLPELAADAGIIFIGRCESVTTRWNDDHTLILTVHRFRVDRVLKGAPASTIVVEELGGIVGSTGMSVAGSPRYQVGEEALLFLYRTPLGRWATCGSGQGRFAIARDRQGRPWVTSDRYASELSGMAPPGADREGAPLATFVGRLQALVASASAKRGE